MKKIAIFISGEGTNLKNLLEECNTNLKNKCEVAVVITSNNNAKGVNIAKKYGIEPYCFNCDLSSQFSISKLLKEKNIDFIFLAGFMKILSSEFVNDWRNKIINIHPSLLPAFGGANAVQQALDYGAKITGCTVHYVDETIDSGSIIAQKALDVMPNETESELHERIKKLEKELYPQVLTNLITNNNQ